MNFLKTNLNIKKDDKVLIISDSRTDPDALKFLFQLSKEIGIQPKEVQVSIKKTSIEPPESVIELMLRSDFIFLVTSKSLTHSSAVRRAAIGGAAVISMPRVSLEMLRQGGIRADPDEIVLIAEDILSQISRADELLIKTELGTNLLLDLSGSRWFVDSGKIGRGQIGNLPGGEVFISPKNANGIVICDVSLNPIGRLTKPIEFIFKNGECTWLSSSNLKKYIDSFGSQARNFAEFAIGINPLAVISGNILEDEKVWGTAHFALGNNLGFGGSCDVSFHMDCVFSDPLIFYKEQNKFKELIL